MPTKTVLLAHGIFRFDQLSVMYRQEFGLQVGPRYFDGIAEFLRGHGFIVHEPAVDFAGSLDQRAAELSRRLHATTTSPIHIIAHSMGGLDARAVLANETDVAARVSCLTTIGTPHHGTTSADHALRLGGKQLIASLLPVMDLTGFRDLTTTSCGAFNDAVRDAEVSNNVRYRTVTAQEDLRRTTPLLRATALQLFWDEGDSDGIVPTTSQRWESTLTARNGRTKAVEQLNFPFPADHLNEVGLWDTGELLGGVSPDVMSRRVKEFYLHLAMTA